MYLIYDKTDNAQRFPLELLLESIISYHNLSSDHSFFVSESRGYGIDVCLLEDKLENENSAKTSLEYLKKIIYDKDQWFYDLTCKVEMHPVKLGIHDSTALFLSAPQNDATIILSVFTDVRTCDGSL